MQIVVIECSKEEKDLALADFNDAGTLGVSECELAGARWRLEACFEDDCTGLDALCASYGARRETPEAVDWVELARAQWEPFPVGRRFFLVPAWREDAVPAGRLRLTMPPGSASGTGLHAATQMALRGLETIVAPGAAVLDLGTGSGILAAAARLLGAGTVYACDIDQDAVQAAGEYLGGAARLFAGSCRSLRDASVDVVAANLSAQALAVVTGDIARVLKPGGRAVLTGFPEDATPKIERLVAAAALERDGILAEAGYAALLVRKADQRG